MLEWLQVYSKRDNRKSPCSLANLGSVGQETMMWNLWNEDYSSARPGVQPGSVMSHAEISLQAWNCSFVKGYVYISKTRLNLESKASPFLLICVIILKWNLNTTHHTYDSGRDLPRKSKAKLCLVIVSAIREKPTFSKIFLTPVSFQL